MTALVDIKQHGQTDLVLIVRGANAKIIGLRSEAAIMNMLHPLIEAAENEHDGPVTVEVQNHTYEFSRREWVQIYCLLDDWLDGYIAEQYDEV